MNFTLYVDQQFGHKTFVDEQIRQWTL